MTRPDADDDRDRAAWLRDLRTQMVRVAARRVAHDAAEDVVQEAMAVMAARAPHLGPGDLVHGRPAAAWCFQVLRHVIGNHYQKAAHRRHAPLAEVPEPAVRPDPLARLEEADRRRLVDTGLARLAREHADCGRYLAAIRSGRRPADLAAREGLDPAVLHRRLYRCRARLRAILTALGGEP